MARPPSFSIRSYQSGDEAAMAQVFHDSVQMLGPRAYSAEQVAAWSPARPDPRRFAARAADGRTTLIAVDDGGAVLAFGDVGPDGYIDLLYCRPDAAGTGVAATLLDTLLRVGRGHGIARFHVDASELARPLFERMGFRLDHRRDFEINGTPIHNYRLVLEDRA